MSFGIDIPVGKENTTRKSIATSRQSLPAKKATTIQKSQTVSRKSLPATERSSATLQKSPRVVQRTHISSQKSPRVMQRTHISSRKSPRAAQKTNLTFRKSMPATQTATIPTKKNSHLTFRKSVPTSAKSPSRKSVIGGIRNSVVNCDVKKVGFNDKANKKSVQPTVSKCANKQKIKFVKSRTDTGLANLKREKPKPTCTPAKTKSIDDRPRWNFTPKVSSTISRISQLTEVAKPKTTSTKPVERNIVKKKPSSVLATTGNVFKPAAAKITKPIKQKIGEKRRSILKVPVQRDEKENTDGDCHVRFAEEKPDEKSIEQEKKKNMRYVLRPIFPTYSA